MVILIGLGFLAWAGVFAFLWEWALRNINGWWGVFMPLGWLIILPCFLLQLGIWGFYD